MKKFSFILFISVLFLISNSNYSQTITNVDALNELSEKFDSEWQQKKARVRAYTDFYNIPIQQELENGRMIMMIDVEDGIPIFIATDNYGAAVTTRASELWVGGSTGLELTGEGYDKLGHWDSGKPRTTHQEFTDQGSTRILWQDGSSGYGDHATHTAGTMIAAGVVGSAKGMSYGGQLKSWNWNNDNSEMAAAAAQGLEISNHSYGSARGWEHNNGNWTWYGNSTVDPMEDYKFGFYDSYSRSMDQIAYNAPNYLIIRSCGNDRGQGPSDAGQGDTPEKDGGDDGFDCMGQEEIAKNVLAVGAVREVLNYTEPEDVKISDFSSWGPADDGRIKPDIVGKGVDVYSTYGGSDTEYASSNGTSMSAPNVSGSCGLLQLHYRNLNGVPMRAATLKGLILHTADEAGPHPGPDYMYGWGLMNTKRAANLISDNQGQNSIDELVLQNNDDYSRDINVPEGADELRVTVSWTDPAGFPVSAQLNPRDPMLVNDLDLKIIDPSRATHYPYKLDPENPANAATTDSENNVDNTEMIVISDPMPGTYTITIDHDGTLTGNQQAFSLIISGIDEYEVVPECSVNLNTPGDGAQDVLLNEWLSWEPANFATSYDIYFGTDGGGTQTPTNVFNGENILENGFSYYMSPSTTYYLQVLPRNSEGVATECNQIWSVTTMAAIDDFSYFEGIEDVSAPALPQYWQSVDLEIPMWQSIDLIGHTGSNSMICFKDGDISPADYNNWFISPPFAFEQGKEYNLSFYYKSFGGNPETMRVYWGNTPYYDDLNQLIFENENFSGGWFKGSHLFIPENDDIVFFGFHVTSTGGLGVFLDDILIEDWGIVHVEETGIKDPVIFNSTHGIIVDATDNWEGAHIGVYNASGQAVLQTIYSENNKNIYKKQLESGLYIIHMMKDGNQFSEKIIIY